jgi:hypothetical protein
MKRLSVEELKTKIMRFKYNDYICNMRNYLIILFLISISGNVYLLTRPKKECSTYEAPNIELLLLNERKDAFKRAYKKARAHYDSLPTKTEIITKYDTIYQNKVDSVLVLPDSVQRAYIIAELKRLYKTDSLPN